MAACGAMAPAPKSPPVSSHAKRRLPILGASPAPARERPLPTVRALEALWREVEGLSLWAPKHFWKWMQARRHMKMTFLEPERLHQSAPAGKVNDCHSCTDSCCMGPQSTVLLRLKDIATLVDVGRSELMTHDKPVFTRQYMAGRRSLRDLTRSGAWRIYPVLRQNSFGACEALSVEGLCTLYPHWPQSCARFPYALDADGLELFYSRRCRSFTIHPSRSQVVQQMAASAVAGYNERIRDALLLLFRRDALRELGLLQHLRA